MALTITDTEITSELTEARAEYRPRGATDGGDAWVMIFTATLPDVPHWYGRLLDRNQAITAMTIEEELAKSEPDMLLVSSLASELPQ